MWKHLAVLLLTIVAFGISLWMLKDLVGPASPWMALMLFLCFLGLAKMAEPLFALRMPGGLRPVRPWESPRGSYGRIGVPAFGSLLRDTPLRYLNTGVYVARHPGDPFGILRALESAEASHFWGALLLFPYMLFCAASGWWAVFAGFLLLQVVGNLYPILHLRSVRGRLERLREKSARSALLIKGS